MNKFVEFVSKASIIKIFGKEKGKIIMQDYLCYNNIDKECFVTSFTKCNNFALPKSAIYVSFHFGPFFNIPLLLLRNKINLNFIASKKSTRKLEQFSQVIFLEKLSFTENNILLGDTTMGMRRSIEKLKNGESLFSLIDTGVGLGNIKQSNHSLIYNLVNSEIYTKSAMIQLAFKYNIPIVPVFSVWKNGTADITFENIFYPSKETSFLSVIKKIWDIFETRYLKYHPEQWESYHTIYKLFNVRNEEIFFENNDYFTVDINSFEVIEEKGILYLCSYHTFNIFKTSKRVINFLRLVGKDHIKLKIKDIYEILNGYEIINMMLANKILIKL